MLRWLNSVVIWTVIEASSFLGTWLHIELHTSNLLSSSIFRHYLIAHSLFAGLLNLQVLER